MLPSLQKPENFISLCLQIMLECDKSNYSERNETAIILDLIGDTSITTHIEVILNTTPDIQVINFKMYLRIMKIGTQFTSVVDFLFIMRALFIKLETLILGIIPKSSISLHENNQIFVYLFKDVLIFVIFNYISFVHQYSCGKVL